MRTIKLGAIPGPPLEGESLALRLRLHLSKNYYQEVEKRAELARRAATPSETALLTRRMLALYTRVQQAVSPYRRRPEWRRASGGGGEP